MTSTHRLAAPFDPTNTIGDPGRQADIPAAAGPLTVGVPDTALDFFSLGDLEIRACATRGWSHRYQGTPRQDFHAVLVHDDVVVVAVADGVSEGEHSQVAAETASRSACKLVENEIRRGEGIDWTQVANRISKRILDEAEYRQISLLNMTDPTLDDRLAACLRTMATTLIVAVVQRVPEPEGFAVEIGVVAGDSAAYLRHAGGVTLVPAGGGKTADGPITSTRVRPLPGPVEPVVNRFHLRPGEMLAVGSDGLGDPVGDGTNDVGRELAARWAVPPTVDQFLVDLNFLRRSFDDDRTCVALWIGPEVTLPARPAPPEVDTLVAPGDLTASDAVPERDAVDAVDEHDPPPPEVAPAADEPPSDRPTPTGAPVSLPSVSAGDDPTDSSREEP